MDDISKDPRQALVQKYLEPIATAEALGKAFYEAVLALQNVPVEAKALGLVGGLEAGEVANRIRSTAGKAAEALADLYAIHRLATDKAVDAGVDMPHPSNMIVSVETGPETRDSGGGR